MVDELNSNIVKFRVTETNLTIHFKSDIRKWLLDITQIDTYDCTMNMFDISFNTLNIEEFIDFLTLETSILNGH